VRRFLELGLLTAFAVAMLLSLSAGPAIASHVQCGDVITQDTTLDSDLIDCPGDGIVIGAEGITLDLGGHTIDSNGVGDYVGVRNGIGPFSAGGPSPGHPNVTVKDGTIREFKDGIGWYRGDNCAIKHVRSSNNGLFRRFGVGISLVTSRDCALEHNTVSHNSDHGIYMDQSSATLRHNVAFMNPWWFVFRRGVGGPWGIALFSSSAVLEHNRAFDNEGGGILADNSSCELRHNETYRSNDAGIRVGFKSSCTVEHNVTHDNVQRGIDINQAGDFGPSAYVAHNRVYRNSAGIQLTATQKVQVKSNVLVDNTVGVSFRGQAKQNRIEGNFLFDHWIGIRLLGIPNFPLHNDGNEFIRNRLVKQEADGILLLEGNYGNLFDRNVTRRSGDDGIDIEEADNTLTRNVASHNVDLGIEAIPGVIDGGGNRAFANGNSLQCLNVTCKTSASP
jgi:parallel beta-helix repeat protein